LQIPDLNGGDFCTLTLTRQLQQVEALFRRDSSPDRRIVLLGSSFGGLTAAWLAERCPQVERLVLLAPAFGFKDYYRLHLSPEQLDRWRAGEPLLVYHYGMGRSLPLDYGFVRDLDTYDETQLCRSVPTLIFHGRRDEVVSVEASRDYGRDRPWCQVVELESDHSLGDVIEPIWEGTRQFLGLGAMPLDR
jgi:pimeloyl-ACP methyl ester carboxylesterase